MMLRDEDVAALRVLVAQIETELPVLAHGTSTLRTSWDQLVARLALGPAPRLRRCPHCGAVGMLEATRCGTCWSSLPKVPEAARTYDGGE